MATKKRYSDINKAIKEAEARREEYYKQVGRVMLEEYPELGDMNVTDMRRAARFLRDNLSEKASSKGAEAGKRPPRTERLPRPDSGGDSAHDARRAVCPWRATAEGSVKEAVVLHPAPRKGVRRAPFRMESSAESSAETGWEQGTPGGRRGQRKLSPRERDVYIQNGGIFRRSEKTGSFVGTSPMLATFFPCESICEKSRRTDAGD